MTSGSAPTADRGWALHLLAWVILVGVGCALFWQSYQRWGDLIIDLGRDLSLPGQLSAAGSSTGT
jgi:hypothetical protein